MRIVLALGGNALLRRGEPATAAAQAANLKTAVASIAALITAGHQVAITHGNGPQIGLLALQNAEQENPHPLDVLGAETDGLIGYLIERELTGRLPPEHMIATMLTQIRVDPRDPAFRHPSKPIGPTYDKSAADAIAASKGWTFGQDGKGWRRLVASPRPIEILSARVIEMLVDRNVAVICVGGGGIPVVEDETGSLKGADAVVDKDFASALLARLLRADILLLLTDVDAVYADWGTPAATPLRSLSAATLDPTSFPPGSMRPKIEAAMEFSGTTGRPAAIGTLADAEAMLRGGKGTRIGS